MADSGAERPGLDAIGLRRGTDKSSRHHDFLRVYESFFAPMRDRALRVLEIGVWEGESLQTWAEFFPRAQVVGADINPDTVRFAGGRVAVEVADQSDPERLAALAAAHGPFDIVVDDGSHVWAHQILTLQVLLPHVVAGGFYVVEDLDTSYGELAAQYGGGGKVSPARYLQAMSDYLVGDRYTDLDAEPDAFVRAHARRLDFVAFARRTAVIKVR
ncbi:MAG: class I SAM-dependent methyltransferase [Janthinobacterium lividum]